MRRGGLAGAFGQSGYRAMITDSLPPPSSIRIVVVGAGAMGGYFASRIAESGPSVLLIDVDENRVSAVARLGLRIEDDTGDRWVAVGAALAAQVSEKFDLIIVFTKGMHTNSAIESVRHLVGERTWFLTLQNGLGNPEAIQAAYPRNRVAMGVTDVPADLIDHTHIRSHGKGSVRLWALDGESAPAIEQISALLERAGVPCVADPEIGAAVWEKATFNAALNAVAALTRKPVDGLDNSEGRALIGAIVAEAAATAAATGLAVDPARILAKIDFALAHHRGHEPSMLQDIMAGRRTEIETINGAIVAAAAARGVATPVNWTVAHLIRIAQRQS